MSSDFDYGILNDTAHRPWPMPDSPWLMTQTWHDLMFAHWPIDVALLKGKVPAAFEIDTFDRQAWLGIVPFRMSNVAPRAVPALPWLSAFPELNVRTYVRVGARAGVYFFSLDATNPVAVGVARLLVRLPYFTAAMECRDRDGWIHYRSARASRRAPPARFVGRYRPLGSAVPPARGTLEHFLTERYCLFTTDGSGRPYTLDIHHPRWPLQNAEAEIEENTMAEASGFKLPAVAPLLHFSKRQDMVAWQLKKLRTENSELRTQNSELRTREPGIRTPDPGLRNPIKFSSRFSRRPVSPQAAQSDRSVPATAVRQPIRTPGFRCEASRGL